MKEAKRGKEGEMERIAMMTGDDAKEIKTPKPVVAESEE